MQINKSTARALRYAARLADRAEKGRDLGDSLTVDTDWASNSTRVEVNVWDAGTHDDVPARLLAIRKELGGTFAKNDPKDNSFANQYARLQRQEEDFIISIVTNRAATCERRVVSVEVIEHPAAEAYTEERPVYEWDCSPLNAVAPDAVSA